MEQIKKQESLILTSERMGPVKNSHHERKRLYFKDPISELPYSWMQSVKSD